MDDVVLAYRSTRISCVKNIHKTIDNDPLRVCTKAKNQTHIRILPHKHRYTHKHTTSQSKLASLLFSFISQKSDSTKILQFFFHVVLNLRYLKCH